jgi:hypothetical protein
MVDILQISSLQMFGLLYSRDFKNVIIEKTQNYNVIQFRAYRISYMKV